MKTFFLIGAAVLLAVGAKAQDFITRGKIEYEVTINNWQWMREQGNDQPEQSGTSQFTVTYSSLLFAWNQAVYREGRNDAPDGPGKSGVCIYTDLDAAQSVIGLPGPEGPLAFTDSLPKIKWRIGNETRKIAGWECRKAVGRVFDSVYVVAFYCPEIVSRSGPELFNGLPGMILGLAIPRQHTTWFATKIELAGIDESKIAPSTAAKGKPFSKKGLADHFFSKFKTQLPPGLKPEKAMAEMLRALSSYTFLVRWQ